MGFFSNLGSKAKKEIIREKNIVMSNPEHKKEFLRKAGRYTYSVGQNIVDDVSTGHSQMFPFTMPSNHSFAKQPQKKRKRQQYNPYPLI